MKHKVFYEARDTPLAGSGAAGKKGAAEVLILQEPAALSPGTMDQEELPPLSPARCLGCPYPSHGFLCWGRDGGCLRTRMADIRGRERGPDRSSHRAFPQKAQHPGAVL